MGLLLVVSVEGKGVAVYGGGRGHNTGTTVYVDPYQRCYHLDDAEKEECVERVDAERKAGEAIPWWGWLSIAVVGTILALGLAGMCWAAVKRHPNMFACCKRDKTGV